MKMLIMKKSVGCDKVYSLDEYYGIGKLLQLYIYVCVYLYIFVTFFYIYI